jgi:hypothetical protein
MQERGSDGEESEGKMMVSWARRFLAVVLVGFSLGAALNIGMEARSESDLRALLVRTNGDLGAMAGTEPWPLPGRYWAAAVVHDVAGGGTVIVPDAVLIDRPRFRNLAGVDVRVEDYDPVLSPQMADLIADHPTIRGEGNIVGNSDYVPFAVVWSADGRPVPALRLWFFEDTMMLIDDRVIAEEAAQ